MIHDRMSLRECLNTSSRLKGLIQAMEALDGDTSQMAQDGMGALLLVISDMSSALTDSLDRLDSDAERGK